MVQAAGAQSKLVNPVYGEAQIQITKPATKMVGGDVVTTVLVKNVDKAPIAGFVAEEYWYDRAGNPLGGGTYRHPRPIQVGEVIVCTFKTPKSPKLDRRPGRLLALPRPDQEDDRAEAGRAEAGEVRPEAFRWPVSRCS